MDQTTIEKEAEFVNSISRKDYSFLIDKALEEDLHEQGDITSQSIFSSETGTAAIVAKQVGILAGAEIARQVFLAVDSRLEIQILKKDGEKFSNGETVFTISGLVLSMLQAERTALNFLGRLSGIATLTGKFVAKIAGSGCKILDTRKTTPGWRKPEKYAVKMGGGTNHRIGLYDMVLIKDNHIAAARGITPAVKKVRDYLRKKNISAPIEVEVTDLRQLKEAISLQVNRIMLDNMTPEMMRQAVEICGKQIPLEASGNVNLNTVVQIASAGVDYISVGALTHSAPRADFSMKMLSSNHSPKYFDSVGSGV
ncbi:MAG TPA: carboxylating nicotinate-nucleotide diphosphorylase [Bacteroidetes bacterium]|nr:carboxylating nicotinate-nucleotide diphosphorylase [Bacteroidota bacterium]